ncbi:hypothetical protein V5799_011283 [Amblyomma americanum]|uniref:Peptidase M13 C-terminal domain-containing protein n=1 Tax=Amblyomma americanum TaxID=6943 RepID=A0AAQ4EHP7_AMBAM
MHERPLPRGQAVVSVDLDLQDVFTLDVFNVLGRESKNKLFDKLRRLLQAHDVLVEAIGEKSLYDPIETDVQLATVFSQTAPLAVTALTLKNCTRRAVEELPQLGEWLFWDKVFAELAPGVRGNSIALNETEVLLPDAALFERLNQTRLLSARGSKSRMANYLGFRLLLLLSPFGTGADDKNVPASLAYALHRNYPTSLHDYQACLRFVNRFEPVVAMRRLHGDWKERLVKPDDLVQMVSFLKDELNVCLKTSSLFFTSSTNIVARILLEFLSGVSWQVLNPELMKHTWTLEHLTAAYEHLNVTDPASVIAFLQSAVQSKRDATSDLSAVQWKGGFLSTTANLARPYKVLEVPLPVFNLQKTLDDSVRHLQLARIGPRIYYAIYKALYFVSENLALDNMTWNPLRYFDTTSDCLWDQYSFASRRASNNSFPSPLYKGRTRDLDGLFNALALASTLDAYAFFVAAKRKQYRFKGSEDLDVAGLFFVEYAMNLCENLDPGFDAGRNRSKTPEAFLRHAWHQVNGPLMNLKEFSKAFSCPPGSFMNPSIKCPLIRKHH